MTSSSSHSRRAAEYPFSLPAAPLQAAAGGYFVVDGFVDEFDFSKTDAENAAAEFLVYYGDRYPLGGQSR